MARTGNLLWTGKAILRISVSYAHYSKDIITKETHIISLKYPKCLYLSNTSEPSLTPTKKCRKKKELKGKHKFCSISKHFFCWCNCGEKAVNNYGSLTKGRLYQKKFSKNADLTHSYVAWIRVRYQHLI